MITLTAPAPEPLSRSALSNRLPLRVALITSVDSAAYADFVKILAARWGGRRRAI